MQSPRINKIANQYSLLPYANVTSNENDNYYSINAAQKRKINVKSLDKNKISPSNKSIIKPSILNQPNNSQNLRNLKLQKKAMRDSRRRSMSEGSIEEMKNIQESTPNEINESNNSNENPPTQNKVTSLKDSPVPIKLPTSYENPQINNKENTENEALKSKNETIDNKQDATQTPVKRKVVNKKNMTEIEMINPNEKFNITEEAKNLFPRINLSQLLSASPSLRKELEMGCKPRVEQIICSVTSANIPIIIGEIEGKYLKILYDTGANVNIITLNALNKLNNVDIKKSEEEQTITIANGGIVSTKLFTKLKININNSCTLIEKFYIINQSNPYFDIIFGRGIQKKYRLYIDPDDDCIYQKNKRGPKKITEIISDTRNNDIEIPLMNSIIISNEEDEEFSVTVEEIIKLVPEDIKPKFEKLLNKYRNCMATSLSQLTTANLEPHSILTITEKPIKLKPYKLSKEQSDVLRNEIISLLEKGLIIPSHSPWSFPVLLVRKKNGKWRLCIDYRKLNDITIKDSYALPFIDELISSVRGAKIFSALDLYSGYHQIPMNPDDIEKTSFTTKFGNYNFKVMPFGLTNAL